MTQWTEKQLSAISRNGNLIVSAAAGSGKTSVMTERICRLISSGTPVENMLVLTFTRSAASEMKERIVQKLHDAATASAESSLRSYLLSQLSSINTACISTIDSFCSRIVHRHGHSLGLEESLRIADPIELSVLASDTLIAMFTEAASEDDPDYHLLLASFRSEDSLADNLNSLTSFLETKPEPLQWLDDSLNNYHDPDYLKKILSVILHKMKNDLGEVLATLKEVRDDPIVDESVKKVLDEDLMTCRAFLQLDDYDRYRDAVYGIQFSRLSFPKGTAEEDKEAVKKARKKLKDTISAQKKELIRSAQEEADLLSKSIPVVNALVRFEKKYLTLLGSIKRKKNIFDFSDIEHLALRLLSDERISEEYRSKFHYIFIDEYQDSNGVQEELINRICRKDNVFLVGDIKQSIYRFRAAEPLIFHERLEAYSDPHGNGTRIDLNENFRSSPEVINAVNSVFGSVMSEDVGEIDYDESAMLHQGCDQSSGRAEIHLISKMSDMQMDDLEDDNRDTSYEETDAEEETDDISEISDAEAEARFIGSKILELTNPETGGLQYGDIAVLLRSTTQAQTIAETLSMMGIPCYAQSSGGYFDSIEVMILLNLLRIIDNRKQDVPLLSVLLSPLFHFTSEELSTIRIHHKNGYFHEAFFEYGKTSEEMISNPELCGKVEAAREFIDTLLYESTLSGVTDLLLKILDDTCYYEMMGSLPGGVQRQLNIDALIEKASGFESSGSRGIWQFLHAMDCAMEKASVSAAQESSGNVVHILSIHKSKGLEFPAVFLAQASKQFNMKESMLSCLVHSTLGIGISFTSDGVRYFNAPLKAIRISKRLESLAEEMRVLYVGMTRAKRYLYITGSYDPVRFQLPSTRPGSFSAANARTPLSWVLIGSAFSPDYVPLYCHRRDELSLSSISQDAEKTIAESERIDMEELQKRFSFQYPYMDSITLPAKQSVSQIIRGDSVLDVAKKLSFDPPDFASEGRMSPARRGTVVHRIMEKLPEKTVSLKELLDFSSGLLGNSIETEALESILKESDIVWYSESDLWRRACASPRLEREKNFTDLVPANKLFETESDEPVLVQGTIDCCFLENNGWILIDYKTDRLRKDESIDEHAETHRKQLMLYADALRHLTGKPVLESYVVFLSQRQFVRL